MIRDLITYLPLAVWCNTVAGPPFDPVLLWYAGRHPLPAAWILIALGSLAAGAGAALEAGLLRAGTAAEPIARPRPRFYLMAFLVAASPVPFSLARAASIRHWPRPWPYALAVAFGRFPRYAATVALWAVLSPPTWIVTAGIAMGVVLVAGAALRRSAFFRSLPAAARDRVTAAWANRPRRCAGV